MKKSNGYFLKGTVKRVCGALAIAVALAAIPVIFDGCQNQTGMEQNTQKEYDANGWNKNDPADLINGFTGTQYDQAGYDRAGYNQAGYDKEGYNKAGYNQYGWNRNGENENGGLYDDKGFKIDGTYKETGSLYDDLGYDRDGYDVSGYDADNYDRNGWYIDNTNLINKFTGTEYDENGVDKNGYDEDGWNTKDPNDKVNKNGTLYDANDRDRDGNPKPQEVEIPQYGAAEMDVTLGTTFGDYNQYSIAAITPTEAVDTFNRIGQLLYVNWFPKLATQATNLNAGYSAAGLKYPAFDSQFNGIAAAEDQTMTNIMLYDGNVDNIINVIFGEDTTNKDKFTAYLLAYQQGHYFNNKLRIGNAYGADEPTYADMTSTIESLLTGLGLTAQVSKNAGVITDESLTAILDELKGEMLGQLNNATGVGTGAAIEGEDQARIKALNAHLLQQIGADRGELKALIDDLADLNYNNTNIEDALYNGGYAMGPQKAGQLNDNFNFNLEFLEPSKNKGSGIQMA
jgi:hypothetical protein